MRKRIKPHHQNPVSANFTVSEHVGTTTDGNSDTPGGVTVADPEIARIPPTPPLAAAAIFCACARASAIRSDVAHGWAASARADACVPRSENEIDMPFSFYATVCCKDVSWATVLFKLVSGTVRMKFHCRTSR